MKPKQLAMSSRSSAAETERIPLATDVEVAKKKKRQKIIEPQAHEGNV